MLSLKSLFELQIKGLPDSLFLKFLGMLQNDLLFVTLFCSVVANIKNKNTHVISWCTFPGVQISFTLSILSFLLVPHLIIQTWHCVQLLLP